MPDSSQTAPPATAAEALDGAARRRLRRIAHHLDPVVLVGEHGLSDAVTAETRRALDDHELIKVRLHIGDRSDRTALAAALAEATGAQVVQNIGKVVVLFRKNPEPNPKLSNLVRFSNA